MNEKEVKDFLNSPEFKSAFEAYQKQQEAQSEEKERLSKSYACNNGYINELYEMNNKGALLIEMVKQRFPIDEIIALLNYDYSRVNKNSNHSRLLKEMTNYGGYERER